MRRNLILSLLRVLNVEDDKIISSPVTKKGVKNVVFSMKDFKEPGPDGFPPSLSQ